MARKMSGNKGVLSNHFSNDPTQEMSASYNKIRVLEPLVTKDMMELTEQLGTSLSGTEFSVKTAPSVEDKLQRKAAKAAEKGIDFDPEETMKNLSDLIRYTQICEHKDIMRVAEATIKQLEEQGYVLSAISNYYNDPYPGTGYQGLHLNFVSPYGQEIELQVHSEESFAAKQEAHGLYETIRNVSTPIAEKEALKEEIYAVHGRVPKPDDHKKYPTSWEHPDIGSLLEQARERTDVVFAETSFADKPYAMAYEVWHDDQMLLCGFENVYSDGSARVYQNFTQDNEARYVSLSSKGEETFSYDAPDLHPTLDQAMNIAELTEYQHVEWMDRNFAFGELEEVRTFDIEHGSRSGPDIEIDTKLDFEDIETIVPTGHGE